MNTIFEHEKRMVTLVKIWNMVRAKISLGNLRMLREKEKNQQYAHWITEEIRMREEKEA